MLHFTFGHTSSPQARKLPSSRTVFRGENLLCIKVAAKFLKLAH